MAEATEPRPEPAGNLRCPGCGSKNAVYIDRDGIHDHICRDCGRTDHFGRRRA